MRALERKGLTDDTLICFTSDHGPWYQGNPGALRGRKASTFEGGFRVPFLAKWPGHIPAGSVANAWCSNLDVLPTLVAQCGLSLPEKPLDGIDISPVLLGDDKDLPRKHILYFSPMGQGGNDIHCIRKGSMKLRVAQCEKGEIYINDRSSAARSSAFLQHPELYDLSEDPEESYDVAHLYPDLVAELQKDLDSMMTTFPPNVVEAYSTLREHKADASTPAGATPALTRLPRLIGHGSLPKRIDHEAPNYMPVFSSTHRRIAALALSLCAFQMSFAQDRGHSISSSDRVAPCRSPGRRVQFSSPRRSRPHFKAFWRRTSFQFPPMASRQAL